MRHFGVRIGKEAVRCGLVDELGSKDDGGHHARHEADGSDDDVPDDVVYDHDVIKRPCFWPKRFVLETIFFFYHWPFSPMHCLYWSIKNGNCKIMIVMMMAMLKIVAPMITYRLERSKWPAPRSLPTLKRMRQRGRMSTPTPTTRWIVTIPIFLVFPLAGSLFPEKP